MESEFIDFVEFVKIESLKFPIVKDFFRCLLARLSIFAPFREYTVFDKQIFIVLMLDSSSSLYFQPIYHFFDFKYFDEIYEYLADHDEWWEYIPALNTIKISPYHLSYYHESLTADKTKKSSGGYFSPREQVDFICKCCLYESFRTDDSIRIEEEVLFQLIFQGRTRNLKRHEIGNLIDKIRILKILDPSCGCGTFLFEMGDNIASILNSLLKGYFITSYEFIEAFEGFISNMIGFDIDFFNAKITELSLIYLWNSRLPEESNNKKRIHLFNLSINANILNSDFLDNKSLEQLSIKKIIEFNSIDICCTNPPFIRHHKFDKTKIIRSLKENSELKRAFQNEKFNLDAKGDIYLYFIINTLLFLKPKGVFGFILSRSWYSSRFSAPLYKLMHNKYFWMKFILETPYEPWEKAEVRTNIVIAQKHPGDFSNDATSLLVWKRSIQGLLQGYIDLQVEPKDKTEYQTHISEKFRIISTSNPQYYVNQINDVHSLFSKDNSDWFPIKRLDYFTLPPNILSEVLLKNKEFFCSLNDLGELSLGSTTGANKFFYLNKSDLKKYNLPIKFMIPMTKSPKDSISLNKISNKAKKYLVHVPSYLDLSSSPELLAYFNEIKDSIFSRPYFKNKNEGNWFRIRLIKPDLMIPNMSYLRSFVALNSRKYHIDKQWIGFWSKDPKWLLTLLGFFNSSLGVLLREVQGTRSLGLGSLKLSLNECKELLTIDPRKVSNSIQEKIRVIVMEMLELPIPKLGRSGPFRDCQLLLDDILNKNILKMSSDLQHQINQTTKFFVEWRLGRKMKWLIQ